MLGGEFDSFKDVVKFSLHIVGKSPMSIKQELLRKPYPEENKVSQNPYLPANRDNHIPVICPPHQLA